MRVVYLAIYLAPTVSVLLLSWFVARAVSVRVVWRSQTPPLDDELA
jgi:hypothetical protein